jgi:cysteine desulfurase/selenocysteine lyase
MDIDKVREMFPVTKTKTFLNHAAISPLPKPVKAAIQTHLEGSLLLEEEHGGSNEARNLFAHLVNAEPTEIALVPNTSTGLNIAANSVDYPRGCNVVTTDLEFPTVTYPWLRNRLKPNVELRYVKNVDGRLLQEDFDSLVDDRTVAVAVSHVEYSNGFRNDLKAIAEVAHSHGALLIADACQSAGALGIDVKRDGIDFLATSSYKWLLGPSGAGFLYVQKDLIGKSEPVFVGYEGVKPEVFESTELWNNRELKFVETASRFETGGLSVLSYVGAVAALKLIIEVGIGEIEKRVTGLAEYLIDRLKEEGFGLQTPGAVEYRSGIVNFLVDDARSKAEKMGQKGVIVSARMNGIRVSPHFYNTEDELERLIGEAKKLDEF